MVDTTGMDGVRAAEPLPSRRTQRRPDATRPDPSRRDGRRGAPRSRAVVGAGTTPSRPAAPRRPAARVALSAVVMAFAAGLVATLALPSYAFDPTKDGTSAEVAGRSVSADGEQRFSADADVQSAALDRDTYSATLSAVLLRRAYAERFASYDGPTAQDFLKNPAHPAFSLDSVFSTALQYRGVPYVFGGADPSGFDCSGFIMFVYAQFGVSLPHSVHQQNMIGTPIAPEDAQPGDVVIFNDNSHDGFYAGDGMILHAPYRGASVRVQKLWTTAVHYVRFGI